MNRDLRGFYTGTFFVTLLATLGTGDITFMVIGVLAIGILMNDFRSGEVVVANRSSGSVVPAQRQKSNNCSGANADRDAHQSVI